MKKDFFAGDRVRLLHEKGEGKVIGRSANGLVRVMLDDGFEMPVVDKNLALVHSGEIAMRRELPPEDQKPGAKAGQQAGPTMTPAAPTTGFGQAMERVEDRGLFFALGPATIGGADRDLYLINNTDTNWVGVLGWNGDVFGKYKTERTYSLEPKKAEVMLRIAKADLDRKLVFQIWGLQAKRCGNSAPIPLQTAWHLPEDFAKKPVQRAPILEKEMLVYAIDAKVEIGAAIDPKKLLDSFFEPKPELKVKLKTVERKVDLHMDVLFPGETYGPNDALRMQLATAVESLDNAVACGAQDLILVHGKGEGVLRLEIHRMLGTRKDIKYFEDHEKHLNGFGETKVTLR